MRIATYIDRLDGGIEPTVEHVADLERAGVDLIWINESYRFDAISLVGYIAARTQRIEIGTGIVNYFSRTPALLAMTAAGCDYVSRGRFHLGIGASGPQVIEGFHGIPYERPLKRAIEYIEACRKVWRREPLVLDGDVVQVPLPPGRGTGLGKPMKLIDRPVRPSIPIWWASMKPRSVMATAELADGWLPAMFVPERSDSVWGQELREGRRRRPAEAPTLEIAAGGILRIGEELTGDAQDAVLDQRRDHLALYVGGMGARTKNFYNDIACAYGYEREARIIQDLYLDGKKAEAATHVPKEWLALSNLVGPPGFIRERVAAYREAGVTTLNVNPVGPEPLRQVDELRNIVDP